MVTPLGDILQRERVAVVETGERLFDSILAMIRPLLRTHPVTTMGVACAGPMSDHGAFVSPLNIAQWRDFPLRDNLRDATGLNVALDGDVKALALAEGYFGDAQHLRNYASLVVSTGIGGAFVLDGELIDGNTGNAGHIGHLNVVPDGAPCFCGSRGCLEAEVSGGAIERQTGREPAMAPEDLRHRTATLVGQAVGTLASVLDFNLCFVAGSVALGFGPPFFARATERAREMAPFPYSSSIEVRPSGLGRDGTLLGAALVGWGGRP
jgi:glucokinase